MPKFQHIYIDLYGRNFYFVCCTRKVYEKMIRFEFNREAPEKLPSVTGTFETYPHESKQASIGVIWVRSDCKKRLPSLVHEIFHATYWAMSSIGIVLSEYSEEAFAYTMQYMFSHIKLKEKP